MVGTLGNCPERGFHFPVALEVGLCLYMRRLAPSIWCTSHFRSRPVAVKLSGDYCVTK